MIYILNLIDALVYAFSLAILIRVILSWVRFDLYHPVSLFIHLVTEPVLAPIRRLLPSTGMIDFSPPGSDPPPANSPSGSHPTPPLPLVRK